MKPPLSALVRAIADDDIHWLTCWQDDEDSTDTLIRADRRIQRDTYESLEHGARKRAMRVD